MKPFLRLLLGTALALVGAVAVHAQQLSPVGITASPGSALPGDTVSYTITVNNSTATQFGPNQTANFTVLFTNLITGATFTVGPVSVAPTSGFIAAATVDPTTNAVTPGTGTFTVTASLPTQTLQTGSYSARVTLNSVTVGTVGTAAFTVSSSVISITGKPDLAITRLDYAAGTSYVGGQTIAMSLDYVNNQSTNGTQNVPYVPGVNGFPTFVRIQVVLSSNPTFGDADDFQLTIHSIASLTNADGAAHTINWNQVLPGNFSGSYYVLAKIDSLNALAQNDPPALNVNGNNVWVGNALNPAGTLINLLPTNFPTAYLASHGTGVTTTAAGYSDNPSISSDGRYVAFASDAANLVSATAVGGADTNAARDIFLFDSQTSLVRRLSLSQQGTQGNAASNNPAISANGRYVAFASDANNLVIGDTNGFSDIFVVDTLTGLITRVSGANATGGQANNPSFRPAISQTGRYIVFESTATNLTANPTAVGVSHVYFHDRDVNNSGTFDTAGNTSTKLIDSDLTTPATVAGNASAIQATISADGTWVAFASKATNLVAPATAAARQHVYVRPVANIGTATSGIKLVSVVTTTAAQGNADSQTPSLSADGRYVAYASLASNLVAGDTNGVSDIFVYDNTAPLATPIVRRVSLTNAGAEGTDPSPAGFKLGSINPTISADGRYVAFASLDDNLTAGDTNGQAQATDSNRALDIFVRDRDSTASGTFDTVAATTTMISVNPFGYQTNGLLGVASTAASNIYPVISANGRFVAYPSDAENNAGIAFGATNLLPLDSNGLRDVFLFDRRTNATVTPATPPAVTITSPGNASTALVNTPISITASATTTVGVVSNVQFFVNGASLGTSAVFPYAATWTPTAVGTYTLSALVTDSFGNLGVSPNVSVTINAAPSVGITSPVAGATVNTGTTVAVNATAAASNPGATIASVQFFANGVSLGTDSTAPYSAAWAPTVTGIYTLTAVATDSIGTQSTSPSVTITVTAPGGGGGGTSTPPTVTLSPLPPATTPVNSSVTLSASAAAGGPTLTITNVQFFANGVLVGSAATAPYTFVWVPQTLGIYAITAVATDNLGASTTSTAASVNVNAILAITLNSPAAGTTVPVNTAQVVAATASVTNGTVVSVRFFANGTAIGTASAFPYTVNWTPVTPGTYALTAIATDNTGAQATSTANTVRVSAGTVPAVAITAPAASATIGVNLPQTITASASSSTGVIASVQFFVNGAALGAADTTFPYSAPWTPTALGTYTLTARAADNIGNLTDSAPIVVTVAASSPPTVAVTNPANGSVYPVGTPLSLAADAADSDGTIVSVQFYVNNLPQGPADTTAPYSSQWTATSAGVYSITAQAIDNNGNTTLSTPIIVTIGANAAPTVALTSPANGTTAIVGTVVSLIATAADADGTVSTVRFIANGTTVGTATTAPYTVAWTPTAAGTYTITAQATDNSGNVTNSAAIAVAVAPNQSPIVALTSPANGTVVRATTTTTITASAADADGTIASVQFFANGTAIGAPVTTLPYRVQWTPAAEGLYRLTALAVDNAGATTTSSALTVLAISATTGSADNVYTGDYAGNGEIGRFAAITVRGKTAAFIGYSTTAVAKTYYFSALAVDAAGGFSATDALGRTLLTATANDTGVSGSLDAGRITLIGINAGLFPATRTVAAGYYSGNLTGRPASTVAAIVGADASITVYVADGAFQTSGASVVDSTGSFTVNTATGNRFTGKADPLTGFLTGTLSGANGGTFTAATSSGVSFSDGFLRNLSTRGQVGTGSNLLIAGFVVGGTVPKQVLIRAIGPTLSAFGLTGALADPQLQVFNSSNVLVGSNNNWGGAGGISAASAQVGAFALAPTSLDAVILAALAPGAYTAQVSGVGGGTGIALVELYDVDALTPFSPQKIMNVATRGVVGAGQAQLIAGFVVSGNTSKKVLIRAVGPTLAAAPFNVAGVLTDPVLRLVRADNLIVRENDNWETGNDSALINDASVRVGAFPLATGSKDAAILINLPPGTYSAQVSGSGTTTGVALIEVYEVP